MKLFKISKVRINNLFIGILVCLIWICTSLKSQTITLHDPELQFIFEDSLFHRADYHGAFKPVEIPEENFLTFFSCSNFNLTPTPSDWKKTFNLQATPIIDGTGNFHSNDHHLLYNFGEGVLINGKLKDKFGFEASAELFEQSFPSYNRYSIDSLSLIPGYNKVLHSNYKNAIYSSVNGFIYWNIMPHLSVKAGKDKQFWGDGDRSLFLSEYSASYPFVQINLNVWKIRYTYQLLFLQDLVLNEGSKRFDKYAAMHMLSYNITSNINIYAFEAVIWRAQDSSFNRSIDVNYTDPFLLFRPVEWSLGSPDNVLLGFGGRWQICKHVHLYGQLLIDDFSSTYISKYGWGWYGNKHAIQAGFKIYGNSRHNPDMFLMEYNVARPYTYSHNYSLENYGYLNRPLAHPYGANFKEILADYRMFFSNLWLLNARFVWTRYGADPPGMDYGSNIYLSDNNNIGISGNFVGQGILTDDILQQLDISRLVIPSWRLRLGITISNMVHRTDVGTNYYPVIEIGLKTLL
jgi:hypothetical protein